MFKYKYMATDITLNRQDTYSRSVNIQDSAGDYIDCTGWTIYFTVRDNTPITSVTTDTGALISKTITGEASGIHTLTLTSEDTDVDPSTYLYDFQIKKGDGTISSSTKASFIVKGDITRSIV